MWVQQLRGTCRGDDEACARIIASVERLLLNDAHLFRVDANERALAHRFAIQIEQRFPGWDVDCEYNRDGHDPKEIAIGSGDDYEHGSRVYPDIIVHRRGTAQNYIVFELKKSSNLVPDQRDFEKLQGYCSQLGYRHGVFLRFRVLANTPTVERATFVYAE